MNSLPSRLKGHSVEASNSVMLPTIIHGCAMANVKAGL